ncbi:MAG: glutaredoxin family protein [Nitrospirae bacterium]|nr:glutaredoxin family protein [Nitrospirota bacterium]
MKDFLSAKGLRFTDRDISVKEVREELVNKHGRMATPTLVIGDKVFLGFRQNREEIEKALAGIRDGGNG